MRLVFAAIAVLAFVVTVPMQTADAKSYGTSYSPYTYDRTTVSKKPRHGFEGFVGVGRWKVYCSYHRYPVRKCNKNGRCRVVAWELRQFCR